MRAEFINPFLKSLCHAFRTMLSCELRRGELRLAQQDEGLYDISGVIGLSGKAMGAVVVSFSEPVALRAASTLLMTECTRIDADVADAVGELANVVAGAAKLELQEYELSISLPNVVMGKDHRVRFPSDVPPVCVPFESKWGPIMLQVGLCERNAGTVGHAAAKVTV